MHVRYYQVIMMIDIFQYSNMYTLSTAIQWLADDSDVRDECGPYATRPGLSLWITLELPILIVCHPPQGRLLPIGPNCFISIPASNLGRPSSSGCKSTTCSPTTSTCADSRALASSRSVRLSVMNHPADSSCLQGFLRRVHRWPVLLPETNIAQAEQLDLQPSFGRKRGKSFTIQTSTPHALRADADIAHIRGRPHTSLASELAGTELVIAHSSAPSTPVIPHRARRASAAESSLEQLRSRADARRSTPLEQLFSPRIPNSVSSSVTVTASAIHQARPPTRESSFSSTDQHGQGQSPTAPLSGLRPRLERSPSAPTVPQVQPPMHTAAAFPKELLPLLDGEHHTDELCTRFEVGWPVLRQWLVMAGGGKGDGDFGQVAIIYR